MKLLTTKRGARFSLPLFLPVYQPSHQLISIDRFQQEFAVEGCIVNAFFLYKERELRRRFEAGLHLREYLAFDGLLVTDSGAFQGFNGPLYLDNKKIIRFQDAIRTDIAAPLDLITPPGDKRSAAERKWRTTFARIEKMIGQVSHCTLAGVQQGGRFLDLRRQCVEQLLTIGIEYLAIGSLVPFFNRRHDLGFVGAVLRDARRLAGPELPIHVYGAGDPLELPFMAALGADIFDSSSYAHYALQGWYMTPYGALPLASPLIGAEFTCTCPYCADGIREVLSRQALLAAHNLWTITATIRQVRELLAADRLTSRLDELLNLHRLWFPTSKLPQSWLALHE